MRDTAFCGLGDYFIEYKHYTTPHNMPVQHYHDSYEVYFLMSGMRNHFIGDEYCRIHAGDVMLVKPFELHYSTCPEEFQYERYVLNIKMSALMPMFTKQEAERLFRIFEYRFLHLNEEEQRCILDIFRRADCESKKKLFLSEKLFKSAVSELLLFLDGVSDKQKVTAVPASGSELIRAVRYINEHYKDNITLSDAAHSLHMSKYHFCRVFKQFTGATFLEYLNNLRLTEAHQMLVSGSHSINEIAIASGFNSTQQLTRIFKQVYGVSPRTFRKGAW